MSHAAARAQAPWWRRGCVMPSAVVAALITVVVVAQLVTFFVRDGSGGNDGGNAFDAGEAKAYQPADVNQIEPHHLFIVRLQDGTFIALYDKSPRQQELKGDCRVQYDETSPLGSVPQLPGFTGAFVEDCGANESSRTVWRADGMFAFGGGYGDLDRFDTHVDKDGHLIVDLGSRTCTHSRGAIGVPPFDVTRCGAGD
jgi:hypothetical protein